MRKKKKRKTKLLRTEIQKFIEKGHSHTPSQKEKKKSQNNQHRVST